MPPEDTTPYENTDNSTETSSSDVPIATPLGLRRADRSRGGLGSSDQNSSIQSDVSQMVRQGLRELEQQRGALQREVDQLERRKAKLEALALPDRLKILQFEFRDSKII